MDKKYELLAIYNECISQGDDPLTALNKVGMTSGVTKEDLKEMDNDLLGGFMSDVIDTPLVVCNTPSSTSSILDDILNPKPTNSNSTSSFDPFGNDIFGTDSNDSDSLDLDSDLFGSFDSSSSNDDSNNDGFDPFDF